MHPLRRSLSAALFVVTSLLCASGATASYLDTLTGREWRNANEVKGFFSWNAVDLVCPNNGTTMCDGSLTPGTADDVLSGWIWGTHAQVIDLFKHVTGLGSELDDGGEQQAGKHWGASAAILLGATQSTETVHPDHGTFFIGSSAWVAESYDVGGTLYGKTDTVAYCEPSSVYPLSGPCHPFRSYVNDSVFQDSQASHADPNLGIWLFRATQVSATVPEPNSILLLFAALFAAAGGQFRHRKN